MNIAHVSVSTLPVLYAFGGAIQRRIMEIAREQARRGARVTVYSVGEKTETREVEGVTVRFLHCKSALPWRHIEFQTRVVAALRQDRTSDVVHFHSQPEGALLARLLSARTVLSYDDYFFRRSRYQAVYQFYKHCLASFDLLLPCSQYCLDESSRYWQIDPARMRVLYNGVNTHQFRPDPERQAAERATLGLADGQRVIVYVGRLCQQKGTDVLLDAYAQLRARRHDVQLVIAGPIANFGTTPDGSDPWTPRIRELGGIYLGPVAEERLAGIYNLADVFVMPTNEMEIFGMAAVEAEACGKPVVASDHGGLKETVPTACGGRFPVGDAAGLAANVERLLDNPDWYAACAHQALRHAYTYDWGQICDTLETLYDLSGAVSQPALT